MKLRRILGSIRDFLLLDIVKTIYYSKKYANGASSALLIYPRSHISVAHSSDVKIEKGTFKVNASWRKTRKRSAACSVCVEDGGKLYVGGNFRLHEGVSLRVGSGAVLNIKGYSYVNGGSVIDCSTFIEIGEDCGIANGVIIQDSDSHCVVENGHCKSNTKPIIIGDHVWIGMRSIILKGVTIGNGSVVAAGSIVTKNVAAGTLVAGNPAKVIKTGINWTWTFEQLDEIIPK